MITQRFHPEYKGSNIVLFDDCTVAYRSQSFANALVFSEKSLGLNELLLIEIDQIEGGWSGHLRVGLTQIDPRRASETSSGLPQYALPDLANIGNSWIYPITKQQTVLNENSNEASPAEQSKSRLFESKTPFLKTSRGLIPKSLLINSNSDILPTDRGSRIGIIFAPSPEDSDKAEMHFIINGEIHKMSDAIPYKEKALYAVIDVYGTTKQIKIVRLNGIPSLQGRCRDIILSYVHENSINKLPLPENLKYYLRNHYTKN